MYRLPDLHIISQTQPSTLYHNGEWPEGFEAGPTDAPEDENVGMDPDEDLPWPKPEALHAWWKNRQGQFRPGTRYLLGKPMSRA